jgi:hypothetical protein
VADPPGSALGEFLPAAGENVLIIVNSQARRYPSGGAAQAAGPITAVGNAQQAGTLPERPGAGAGTVSGTRPEQARRPPQPSSPARRLQHFSPQAGPVGNRDAAAAERHSDCLPPD